MKHLIASAVLFLAALSASAQMPDFTGDGLGEGLLRACRDQDLAAVKALLAKGADPDYKFSMDGWDWYPLVIASGKGNLEIVRTLVEAGATVNICNFWTPLYGASQAGHLEVVKYLISKGAAMNIVSQRLQTPLMTAAAEGREDVVDELLKYWWASQYVFTWADAAWWAAYSGKLSILRKIEAKGHPLNMKSAQGDTILSFLMAMSPSPNLEVLAYILGKGVVDVSSRNSQGKTALEIAREKGFTEAAALLAAVP